MCCTATNAANCLENVHPLMSPLTDVLYSHKFVKLLGNVQLLMSPLTDVLYKYKYCKLLGNVQAPMSPLTDVLYSHKFVKLLGNVQLLMSPAMSWLSKAYLRDFGRVVKPNFYRARCAVQLPTWLIRVL
jgi:hypothetical protein